MKDQRINLISLYFLIIAIGAITLIIYYLTCLILVYDYKGNSTSAPYKLYWLFVAAHLLLNIFIIAKPRRFSKVHRIISSTCILLVYITIAALFK